MISSFQVHGPLADSECDCVAKLPAIVQIIQYYVHTLLIALINTNIQLLEYIHNDLQVLLFNNYS